jgi:protocadherin-16/23
MLVNLTPDLKPFLFYYRYSLEGTDFFSIDESSGMISTKLELDREILERHIFRVLARDSSEFQPLTGTATITVRVTDVDDNRPVFEMSGSNDFFIPNGVKEGDFILGVSGNFTFL